MVAASLKKHAWLPKAEAEIMAAEAIYKLTSMETAKGIIIGNEIAAMPQKLPTTNIKTETVRKHTTGNRFGLKMLVTLVMT